MSRWPFAQRWQCSFPSHSLCTQLLLWLALPIILLVLTILLVEVNSHERVMQRLAQARADSLATTTAALVGAQFDYARDILVQLAGSLRAEATVNESALSLFSVGLARYRANGELVSAPSVGRWQATAQVRTLARWVSAANSPSFITWLDEQTHEWFLVLATPIAAGTPADVLACATSCDRLLS